MEEVVCQTATREDLETSLKGDLAALKDRIHADHLALVEKLEANHRELLAALDRQATRINAIESGLARVDERTSKGGRTSS